MTLWQLFKGIPSAIAALIVGVGMFLRNQWAQYTEVGQALWVLALVGMGVDAGISYEFGSTLSYLHAAGFALVALAFCMLPDIAALEWRKGNKVAAGWIGVACIPLGLVAFLTHVGYSSSIRVGDMQQAGVQNTIHMETGLAVDEQKKSKATYEAELAALKAGQGVGAGWESTRPAAAWEADILNMEGDRVFKRSKQCSNVTIPESRAFCDKLTALRANLAAAKKMQAVSDKIATIEGELKVARATASKTEFKSSAATNHNDTLFKAMNLVVNRSFKQNVSMDEREATNTGIMGISSIAFLLLTPLFYFAAGLNRRRNVLDDWMGTHTADHREAPKAKEGFNSPRIINNTITDKSTARAIREAITSSYGNGNAYA